MAYPQNPVTVAKGGLIVKDVYLSDLAAWQAEGYEIYDPNPAIAKQSEPIAPKKRQIKIHNVESE